MKRRNLYGENQNGKRKENGKNFKGCRSYGGYSQERGQWDLVVCIGDEDEESVLVEMCQKKDYGGDLIMDPFMRICLKKDRDGHITQAIPQAYQSDSLFMGRTDINERERFFEPATHRDKAGGNWTGDWRAGFILLRDLVISQSLIR